MTPKLHKDSTKRKKRKLRPLTSFDGKIFNNISANGIQQCIKCYTPSPSRIYSRYIRLIQQQY